VEVARSKILAAEAQAALSQASIETASANIQQNESLVRQAELNLSYAKVTAPESVGSLVARWKRVRLPRSDKPY